MVKAQFTLLPWGALRSVAHVLGFGSQKHGSRFGWRKISAQEHLDAAFRHLTLAAEGVELDDESNLPHLAHAAARVLFALDLRSKVKGQSRSMSISREHLIHLTGEEVRAIFEDHRQTDLDLAVVS